MALGADCGSSTVLVALYVATTARRQEMGKWGAPRRLRLPDAGLNLGDGKSEIRNPKSEIFPAYAKIEYPPSTMSVWPWIMDAYLVHRKMTTLATS